MYNNFREKKKNTDITIKLLLLYEKTTVKKFEQARKLILQPTSKVLLLFLFASSFSIIPFVKV